MVILVHKMLRDIRQNRAQFFAIFLMIFLGVFIYSGVNSEWNGLQFHSEKFYHDTKLSDVWVMGSAFTKAEVLELKKESSIQGVERRAVLSVTPAEDITKKLTLYVPESYQISQMKLMEGEEFSTTKKGIWLDQSYAHENGIHVGDNMSFDFQGILIQDIVKGLVLHPEFIYQQQEGSMLPNHTNNGYAYISSQSLSFANQLPYTQLLIKTKHPASMEHVIKDRLQRNHLTCIQRSNLPSYAALQSEIVQHKAFGNVFPIVFLLIAVLTTLTTLSKLILHQRLQIGILKAVGFSNRAILFHYVSHILCITTLGALLGYLAGPLLLPNVIYPMMKAIYVLPELTAVPVSYSIYLVVISVLTCFLVALVICRRQVREQAAQALRPAVNSYRGHSTSTHKFWGSSSFYTQWNLRDILRNKIRTCMAIIGVAGCMGLLFCALGIQDSMQKMLKTTFEEQQRYEISVNVEEKANLVRLKQRIKGEAVQEVAIELKHENVQKTASLLVLEGTTYRKLQDSSLHYIPLAQDGIAISRSLAKQYGVKEGDRLSWRILGDKQWSVSTIKNMIYTPVNQGITISKKEFKKLGYPFTPTSVIGKEADLTNIKGIKNVQYLQRDVKKDMEQMMEGMILLIMMLILGAILLGVVVLYNIGTFAYMEKIREMATLKVLGFQDKQVKKLLRQQNLWLTLGGILLGIPFGYLLIYTVTSTIGDAMDLRITLTPLSLLICIGGTLLISLLVMCFVSNRTKQIDMVSALKGVD